MACIACILSRFDGDLVSFHYCRLFYVLRYLRGVASRPRCLLYSCSVNSSCKPFLIQFRWVIMLAIDPLLLQVKHRSSVCPIWKFIYRPLKVKLKNNFGFISSNSVPQIDHTKSWTLAPQRCLVLGVEVCWSCLWDPTPTVPLICMAMVWLALYVRSAPSAALHALCWGTVAIRGGCWQVLTFLIRSWGIMCCMYKCSWYAGIILL
jgi:hypothetical protein